MSILAILAVLLVVIGLGPLAVMWAVNILIPGAIPYTLWHFAAVLILILIFKPMSVTE